MAPLNPQQREAVESGVLSVDELKSLIEQEAALLGLTFDAAVERERAGRLPATSVGTDLTFLIRMLLGVTAQPAAGPILGARGWRSQARASVLR